MPVVIIAPMFVMFVVIITPMPVAVPVPHMGIIITFILCVRICLWKSILWHTLPSLSLLFTFAVRVSRTQFYYGLLAENFGLKNSLSASGKRPENSLFVYEYLS